MGSSWMGSRRLRFDFSETPPHNGPTFPSATEAETAPEADRQRLSAGIERTRDYLLGQQHADGFWVGELEGDTILESEYLLLLTFLGKADSEEAKRCANYILEQQLQDGGWAIYPDGPLEISASVKAYFALKITGHAPHAESMQRAKNAILAAGGAEQVNSFTRYYLALLGVIGYDKCPAVPPELMLIPNWMPFNIYEMSAWSRTIIVPLSLLWAFRPACSLPAEQGIRELFINSPEELPVSMGPSESLDAMHRKSWLNWGGIFRQIDRTIKLAETLHLRPFRQRAIRIATEWMLTRFDNSDGLGAIFPPIIWSVVALKCLGYDDDSPEVWTAMNELDKLKIREGETIRLQPCQSPVWDTAIATLALREANVPPSHPAISRSVDWLLSKEVRSPGDWSVLNQKSEATGWFFEFHNEFYPDVDDTIMVMMALCRCLPNSDQPNSDLEFLLGNWNANRPGADAMALFASKAGSTTAALDELELATPQLNAIRRAARWILAFQNRDGGWGAFDADNDRELFTRVPFADHNAMIDPSTADLTARVLEMFGHLGVPKEHPALQRAMEFVWREQEPDHCWYGRWGVNYIYGTWQSIVGLTTIGWPNTDSRIRKAADWLKEKQQASGGWGETPRSYEEPNLRGTGEPTASQTAWAILGLLAAGEIRSDSVRRGVDYLLETQNADGTWDETNYTGTGFPRVFYLKYHLYRIYFPLMALAKYDRISNNCQ